MQQQSIQFGVPDEFRQNIRNGIFSIITEIDPPLKKQQFSLAITPMRAALKAAAAANCVVTTLINDRAKGEESYKSSNLQPLVTDVQNRVPIVTISGKGRKKEELSKVINEITPQNTKNFLAVTGNRSDLHIDSKAYEKGYVDSLDILKEVKERDTDYFVGVAMNPFKYDPASLLTQYCKLVKKVKNGADFVMTQCGWDMGKFQELQWFMQMRGINIPVIARVLLPSLDDIKNIENGVKPGVNVSKVFASSMQREANINYEQALAANIHRIGLIVAGCKILGYSGVSICGLTDERTTKIVLDKVKSFTEKYKNWKDWLVAWNEFHGGIRFAPETYNYYLFDGLMTEQRSCKLDKCTLQDFELEPLEWRKKLRYRISSLLRIDRSNGPIYGPLKMFMYKSLTSDRRLCYLPSDKCPKGLIEGPCGGTLLGGECEFKHGKCLFTRLFSFAKWLNIIDKLEG